MEIHETLEIKKHQAYSYAVLFVSPKSDILNLYNSLVRSNKSITERKIQDRIFNYSNRAL